MTKVFLSLSFVDAEFVRAVHSRLPVGLAHFYEKSFENGELLFEAMERSAGDSTVFALFASKDALASPWVNFEIDRARVQHLKNPKHRLLIFPTSPEIRVNDFPEWLRAYWVSKAGATPNDVARYITAVLLEPDRGISVGATRVVGRGKAMDALEQLAADHIGRLRRSPNVYVLAGVAGIGRRTFATYFARRALSAAADLPYGPVLSLSPQADVADIYRALRNEISGDLDPAALTADIAAFTAASLSEQITEIGTLLQHFVALGQAVTIVSTNGFHEDAGEPKSWVAPLLASLKGDATLFVVTNRQFPTQFVESLGNAIQYRVPELTDKDIKALMVFTAQRLSVEDFSVPDGIVAAIGGHPDVANAAVRLIAQKGPQILARDPRQLFNVQNTILGENIEEGTLTSAETAVLQILGWVPSIGGDILVSALVDTGRFIDQEVMEALENLILGCLVDVRGYTYSIASSIRLLFRRFHVTPQDLLNDFSAVLAREWQTAEQQKKFRSDLFEAFVFMHALEGKALPRELRGLLSPGTLYDVVRDTYARGKDSDEKADLESVVSWGDAAENMTMSEATREEILSTVVRAEIRLGRYREAESRIALMARRGNRSVSFLKGHMHRRQGKYADAVPALRDALNERKYNRSAVHELALALKKSGKLEALRKLLSEHGDMIKDSAMFADLQIGIDLARGDLNAVEVGISNLRRLPDDEGKADLRFAQLQIRRSQYGAAKQFLSRLLEEQSRNRFQIRSLRLIAAARDKDFALARKDLDFIKGLPGRHNEATRLEINLLIALSQSEAAQGLLNQLKNWGAEDALLQARIYELQAEEPGIGFAERSDLKARANQIRVENRFADGYDIDDEW